MTVLLCCCLHSQTGEKSSEADGEADGTGIAPVTEVRAEDAEPSWELPPELQEFTGAADDRKGLLEWRQRVSAERQRLEKEKLRWQAEKRRKEKEREKHLKVRRLKPN